MEVWNVKLLKLWRFCVRWCILRAIIHLPFSTFALQHLPFLKFQHLPLPDSIKDVYWNDWSKIIKLSQFLKIFLVRVRSSMSKKLSKNSKVVKNVVKKSFQVIFLILTTFWQHLTTFLTTFRQHFDNFLTTFWHAWAHPKAF